MVKTGKILRKVSFRELKDNFKNYISVILIALLSVALFTGLSTNHQKLEANKNLIYEQSNMGDYFVTTSGYTSSEEYNTDYEYLKQLSLNITPRLYTQANSDDKSIVLIAYENKELSHEASIIEGTDGVLISNNSARSLNAKVGDVITISVPYNTIDFASSLSPLLIGNYDYIANNEILIELTISGIMTHSEAVDKTGNNTLYLPMNTLKEGIKSTLLKNYNSTDSTTSNFLAAMVDSAIDEINLYNQFVLKSSNSLKQQIDNYYNEKENNNLVLTMTPKTLLTNSSVETDIIQASQLLLVFPVVFYIVGVLVIITSLSQLINKDKNIIGCMSSLGISKKQIITHYSFFACMLTFIGGIIGCIIGPLLIPSIMNNKYNVLYSLPVANIPFVTIEMFICFLVLFVVAFLASLGVTYKIASKNPSRIFRDDVTTKGKGKVSNHFKFISLPIKMSLRNLKNNYSRSIMVIIGVMGCSALLVCGFGIDNTLDYGITNDVINKTPYDIYGELSSDDLSSIYNIEGVDKVEGYYQTTTSIVSSSLQVDTTLYVYSHGDIININYSDEGAYLTTKIAKKLDVKVGDTVSFNYKNKNYDVKVVGIEEMFFNHGIILSNVYLDNNDLEYNNNYFYVTGNNISNSELKTKLEEVDGVTPIFTIDEFMDKIDDTLSGIRMITLTVKAFAIILAIVVIYNLALLNFKERIRDIATLKVLGFGQKEVAKTLLVETSILTVIGSVIGMFLGFPLLRLLLGINEVDAIEYLYHIDIVSYFYALLLTVIVSVVINFFITFYTNKIEMVESLKSIE